MSQSVERLIQESCDRVDRLEPRLHAMLPEKDRRARLLAEAVDLDPAIKPFLIGVKDIINVDGFPTQVGSMLPAELFEGPEATVVTRLKAAGALVIGKTTTTEFAFREPAPTTNPYNQEHTPGGSSSGSAAAVAANYVPLALGTQTVDSIVTPAAFCGVVGFKPSFGRIPIDGVLPFSTAMDTVGFLSHDVETTTFAAKIAFDDWTEADDADAPAIGLPSEEFLTLVDSQARACYDRAIEALANAGCRIVQTEILSGISEMDARHSRLIAAQFASVHREWYASYSDRYRSSSADLYAEGDRYNPSAIQQGIDSSARLRKEIEQTMDDRGIDVWLSPATVHPAPHGLSSIGDPTMGLPWTHAHMPAVCLPAGLSKNRLPLGVQIAGRYGKDEELLGYAASVAPLLGWNPPSRNLND